MSNPPRIRKILLAPRAYLLVGAVVFLLAVSGYVARDASKVAGLHPADYKSVSYSGVAQFGDSRLLRPEWKARPAAFEVFYVLRSVVSKVIPTQSLKRQVFAAVWMWVSGWLLITSAALCLIVRHQISFGTVLLFSGSVTYAYYFFAFRPTVLPYDLPATAIVPVLIFVSSRLMRSDSSTKWYVVYGACLIAAVFTKESVLVIPVALTLILMLQANKPAARITATLVIGSILLRTFYSELIGTESIWVYQSSIEIFTDNIEALRGVNWVGAWYRHPALYFVIFIPMFTPLIRRSKLNDEQILLLRIALALFIVMTFALGQIRESRILLEWALPMTILTASSLRSRIRVRDTGAIKPQREN